MHLKPQAVTVPDLDEFTVTLAPSLRPECVLGSEDLPRVIVEKDDRKLCRLLAMNLRDVRGRLPNYFLLTHYLSLEYEVIQTAWVTVLIPRLRPLPDGDFDRYREFLEGRAVLIMG
ncbi:MAG: hypothetical protein E6K65_09705 [Nitrospirae bacterium]|nr:MAG: hypothetical protein E6K65_09705 [Nitrospirota bacterium]